MKDYVVMDLENPNFRQNSICAIGTMLIRDNKLVEKKYSLINPEDTFDYINIQITQIEPHMVENSPTLPNYWKEIETWLTENTVVGHNITYDLSVLSKSLQRYNLPVPEFNYCCTLTQSRKNLYLPSYKLENIAKRLGIIYKPHNAIEDAKAAYELFEYINKRNPIEENQIRHYKYTPKKIETYDAKLSTNINNLYGMIKVILSQETIKQEQLNILSNWLNENIQYKQYPLFEDITQKLDTILTKGYINKSDKEALSNIESIKISNIYKQTTLKTQILQGMIKTITADNKVTITELIYLKKWLEQNPDLKGKYIYDKILKITYKFLQKGKITQQEEKNISQLFKDLLNPIKTTHEKIDLEGKTFCLSGDFKHGTKQELVSLLEKQGLIKKSCISYQLDYLFVGDLGSPGWKYGNIGGKIIKAQQIQNKGAKIKIISEKNLFEELDLE